MMNKELRKKNQQLATSNQQQMNKIGGWYFFASFFILAFVYFFWFGNYILFFQEQQSLFVYSTFYFQDFIVRPGGLLDLAGRFLTQFYVSKFAGSVIIAISLCLPGMILFKVSKQLIPGSPLSLIFPLLPSSMLLLMQTHYYHLMLYDLGFILIMVYFLLMTITEKTIFRYILLAMFPVFFYITGAYAAVFLCMFVLYCILYLQGPHKYFYIILLLLGALFSSLVFKQALLLQTYKQLILFPLPFINDPTHKVLFWLLTGYLILYPVFCKLMSVSRLVRKRNFFIRLIPSVLIFAATIILLITGYNSQNARVINLEKMAFEQKWDEAIKYQEKYPSANLIGQYFFNVALSETDQLCDKLFYGPQDFGTESLILKWSSEYLEWGAFSFYTTGLINEAQRWAYEEMVVYGLRPQNMKLLTKTSLLTGNYLLAKKYTSILKNTLFYKKWAEKYAGMAEDTSLIRSDPELGKKLGILPGEDFFIYLESPESNLPMLVDQNPENKKAFEYMMAWLLLGKEVQILTNNIRLMKDMGYTRIPRHIEEAVMIYYNSQGVFPDLGGLTISSETKLRFDQYFAAYMTARQNPSTLKEKMQKFSNSFWYYFHFK